MKNTALIIIDVQNDYFKGGACELHEPEAALCSIQKLLKHFRDDHAPVFFIQHIGSPKGSAFVPGTHGLCIHDEIKPLIEEPVITKHYPSSFLKTTLQNQLQKADISNLVVCGMMTHMCVDTTVRAAMDYGYSTTLISDACTTKHLDWNGQTIDAVTVHNVYIGSLAGAFADVKTTEEYLSQFI